jgi:hypothetical protein
VLTLDRTIGDFENADVLIEGKTISAVRPNITAPNAEIIDAGRISRGCVSSTSPATTSW